tara:strand:- start:1622 stop:2434 length:813 start_codon:yes stop_codon:yes gene_type:complete
MPELPEVESLRRYLLREGIIGKTFELVSLERKPPGRNGSGAIACAKKTVGQTIIGVLRHGKQIALELNDFVLGAHMGMTGQIHIQLNKEPKPRFTRAVLTLSNSTDLILVDPRRWARFQIFDSVSQAFSKLGPDAIDDTLTSELFTKRFSNRKSQIKPLLLNQEIVAGIGNIYADESLHRAKISPTRGANTIPMAELRRLHTAIRTTLNHAVKFIENHPDELGRPYIVDAYDERMQLKRKSGGFCPRCEIPLAINQLGGRTTYFCSKCQR